MTRKLLWFRFYANLNDCRPVNYPVEYPWWRSGESETHSIILSYGDSEEYILKNWPEATNIAFQEVKKIVFTSRFPQLGWKSETIPYQAEPETILCPDCAGSGEVAGDYFADDGMTTCDRCKGKGEIPA